MDPAASALWVDPDNLEIKFTDCICVVCFGVMKIPTSGCPEGHSFCRACIKMEHRLRKKCPVCRWDMADIETLVYNRPLEGVIKQLRLRCEHRKKSASDDPTDAGVVAGGSAAKKSKPCPLIDMTVQMLKVQLAQRSLVVTGNKDALKMRLQESMDGETFDNAGCEWVGSVSEAFAHREVCGFVKLKCPTIGCLATPTRRTFTAHVNACTPTVLCANEGCTVKYKATGEAKHLSNCAFEMVMCPCAGCGMKMPRGQLMKHATDAHIWKTPDGPVNRVITMWNTETIRKQAWESEQRFGQETTGVTSTSYVSSRVVNWACGQTDTYGFGVRVCDGWGDLVYNGTGDGSLNDAFRSEVVQFDGGGKAQCYMRNTSASKHVYNVGISFKDISVCKLHITFSILDKYDKLLRTVWTCGSQDTPVSHDLSKSLSKGAYFTTSDAEKEKARRDDGTVRVRVAIRLFRENN
jgi:hypothetical protein